jgi:hypothetical protein
MHIKIPLPEKVSTNQIYSGIHWAKRKKLADLYHQSLLEHRKKEITEYPVEITYIFDFKAKPLDTTNCTFMVKMLEDSLVLNGILKDDDPKHVSFTGIYSQKGTKDEVTITIT